jgi:hypothetical protein
MTAPGGVGPVDLAQQGTVVGEVPVIGRARNSLTFKRKDFPHKTA